MVVTARYEKEVVTVVVCVTCSIVYTRPCPNNAVGRCVGYRRAASLDFPRRPQIVNVEDGLQEKQNIWET